MDPLITYDRQLTPGEVIERPNRFVVIVRFDKTTERVFLADPGALEDLIEPGREILCSPANDRDRKTAFDAIAVRHKGFYVGLRAVFANELFAAALEAELLPDFEGYRIREREPELPGHGRTDFRLVAPSSNSAFVEVKSCTHVEDAVAKFPDRQTERGRRHLRELDSLVEAGHEAYVVFVVQRPDAETFRPYRSVDPEFAELLERVSNSGVGVNGISTEFDPPLYWLRETQLPIEYDW